MRLNQESLDHMARQDYHALEDHMCAWAVAALAELQSAEKPRQIIIDLLGWARGEFHRRRRYMKQEEPETERQAGEVLRALVEKSLERKKRGSSDAPAFSCFRKFCPIPVNLLLIAVLLGKHTAAVLLHIESQLPGPPVPLPEIGPEIPVQKFYAVLRRVLLRRPDDAFMVLVEAGQQRGGEGGKAVFRRILCRPLDPVLVAVGAAVVNVPRHVADEVPEAVILLDPHLQTDGGGVLQQTVPPGLVLLPGVNVGVVPKSRRFNALGPEGVKAAHGAGGAAAVEKNGFHGHASLPSGIR